MNNYSKLDYITNYRGEFANEYDTHLEYVEMGAWEKDFFEAWIEGCSDYPTLCEIMAFCKEVNDDIELWLNAVGDGEINPEVGIKED